MADNAASGAKSAREIGIGIVGGGYMGKAHAVAMAAVGAVFGTPLRPRLEMVAASSSESAERYRAAFGFARGTDDWRALVADPKVEAIVIASPQTTHREIAEAAFAAGKPVFCEKPLGTSVTDAKAMVAAAEGHINMCGFNYVRTPATQYAQQLIEQGRIGRVHWFRGEHTEDFLGDPALPATWRTRGMENGTLGDLAPHMVNCALALMGPVTRVMGDYQTVFDTRGGEAVTNDDQAQMMVNFANGATGHLFFSRVANGKKMGYAYEIHGDKGAIRFDQEDQNALWLYMMEGPDAERGFRKILTGPAHPNYAAFCQGPGHGTGYQDQIIIEARDFLNAIAAGENQWPIFADGLAVWQIVDAAITSAQSGAWVDIPAL
ncbi:MAG: Gfo/Idh/MocA family oxidoreductase [Pseudomonadota bacterium]